MGEQAQRFFAEAGSIGGIAAKVKLAALARITSAEAGTIEDTPDVVKRLDEAIKKLRPEKSAHAAPHSEKDGPKEGDVVLAVSASPEAITLRRHLQTYVELMSQRALVLSTVESTIRRIDEASCTALDVERVSVWFLDEKATKITCADLFERKKRAHSSGTELFAKDFSPYFRALSKERTIAAHDACADPRTSCFAEVYLKPLGISAMLDVPIWAGNKMVGVICHEHVGPKRKWNSDEETFAYLMSNFVALALERPGTK